MVNKENFQLYKHAWIDKCAPHHGEKLSQDDIRLLLSNGGVMGSRGNVRGWEHTLLAKYLD